MSSGKNFGGVSYRFNNVTVDGASFNNSFGLASALGASGTEPISLEALEQVQVMICLLYTSDINLISQNK